MAMVVPERDAEALAPLLPVDCVGNVETIEPITLGLSGAGVYAVGTSRGAYVLRVQRRDVDEAVFARQLRILRRVSDAGVAPALVHVDERARAVVTARVPGLPFAAALANPTQRGAALASIIERLRTLHALDASDVAATDPVHYARATWDVARSRSGFPPWAASLSPTFDAIAATLAADPRRVLSHNDVNPMNVLWDSTRAWLVDWDVAALGHPHYDLATLSLFLRLEDEVAFELAARHDGTPLDDASRATFRGLRQLVGLACGLTFLGLVDDLNVLPAAARADAPTLESCYAGMRAGTVDMQTPRGRASMGLALLAASV